MRPLSVDILNIIILYLILAKLLVTYHPLLVSALVLSPKFVLNISPDLTKSSGSCPIKLSLANIHHSVMLITSGKAETVVQVSKLSPINLSFHRQYADNSGEGSGGEEKTTSVTEA